MAIFPLFKMAAAAIMDFQLKLRHHAKFRRNRSKRGQDMVIFRFSKMAAAYSRPFWPVFGAHFPQKMSLIVLTQKGPSLGGNTSFEP